VSRQIGGPCQLCGKLILFSFPLHNCTPDKPTKNFRRYAKETTDRTRKTKTRNQRTVAARKERCCRPRTTGIHTERSRTTG
jgi:hypothetical protein